MNPGGSSPEARIDAIAARQHGVVTRRQLLEAGLTARMVFQRAARQRLVRVHRGVYRVGPVVSPHAREMAAVLACGTGAVVSEWSAAHLWQLPAAPAAVATSERRTVSGAGDVFITAAGRDCGRREGIRLRRVRALDPSEVTRRLGIPVTTPARTLLDIAADLARYGLDRELEQAFGHASRERLTTRAELMSLLDRHPKRRGARLLRTVMSGGGGLTRSRAEAQLLTLLRSAGLPEPRVNAIVAGFEVDFFWGAQRLVVEVDGFQYHAQRDRFENDRARGLAITATGISVIRLTWRQITQYPNAVIGQIALALGRAAIDPRHD